MNFEGEIPQEHTNLRAAETWIKYLDAYHLCIFNVLAQNKKYDGTAWVIIPKGKNAVDYLINNYSYPQLYHIFINNLSMQYNIFNESSLNFRKPTFQRFSQ